VSFPLGLLTLLVTLAPTRVAPVRARPARADDPAALYAAGQDEAALAACDAALAAKPGDAATIELRARCLVALQRFDAAAEALRSLSSRSMASDLLFAVCETMSNEGGKEGAKEPGKQATEQPESADAVDAILKRWSLATGEDAELRLARARVLLARRRVAAALADARVAAARAPTSFEARLVLARCLDASGQPAEAKLRLGVLLQDPAAANALDVHLRREAIAASAAASMRMQQHEDAIALLAPLVKECPAVVPWRAQLATALGLRNRYAEAIEQWEKAVELAPEDGELRWRLADVYRSQGRSDEAIGQFERMLALGWMRAVAELRLAELLLERDGEGDVERARGHAEQAVALAPESGDVLETRARVQERLGDVEGAKASHRQAFARNPVRFDALYRLALLLARSGDEKELAESEQLLERYRRIEPFLLDLKRAKQEVDVNPSGAGPLARMAHLLNQAGEYEAAKLYAVRAEQAAPQDPQVFELSGYVFANLHDREGARSRLLKASMLLSALNTAPDRVTRLQNYVRSLDANEELPLPLTNVGD